MSRSQISLPDWRSCCSQNWSPPAWASARRCAGSTIESSRSEAESLTRVCQDIFPLGGPTPSVNLGLKVGELVRVKSRDGILATVDELLFNRGMGFHPEMMPYCGKTFRVKQRLSKLMNEKTGQLVELKNSCLVLEGADCHGRYAPPLSCPRECFPYWREIWLERLDVGAGAADKTVTRQKARHGASVLLEGERRSREQASRIAQAMIGLH